MRCGYLWKAGDRTGAARTIGQAPVPPLVSPPIPWLDTPASGQSGADSAWTNNASAQWPRPTHPAPVVRQVLNR